MKDRQIHFPREAYHQLYDPAAGPLWSAATGLRPEEDGDHYCSERDFFEWWYFDAALANGYTLVAILHSSLYNAVDHKPTVDLRVYAPDGRRWLGIGRFEREAMTSSRERCDVCIADCHACGDGSRYELRLRQGEIEAELEFRGSVPGWKPGTGYLFRDQASGRFFRWIVPLPRAEVTGWLRVGEETLTVTGEGYHDHNWGNVILADAFSRWTWGRVFAGDYTLIYGDVVSASAEPEHVTPFLLARGERILLDTDRIRVASQNPLREPRTGTPYPTALRIRTNGNATSVRMSLLTTRVIEALDFARSPFRQTWLRKTTEAVFYLAQGTPLLGQVVGRLIGNSSYLRLEAHGELSVSMGGRRDRWTGPALYEMMVF